MVDPKLSVSARDASTVASGRVEVRPSQRLRYNDDHPGGGGGGWKGDLLPPRTWPPLETRTVVLASAFVGSVCGGQQRLKGVGSTPWKRLKPRSLASPSSSSQSEVISTGSPSAEVPVADRTGNRSWTEA